MTIYLAPPATDEARRVGGRLYRKQVLKKGPLKYTANGRTRTLNFDDRYMSELVRAFDERAYDSVPFVLADESNRHTMAPERARGEVVGLEATPDGLDAVVRLTGEAATVVDQNPKFGVSARIVEGLERGDGKAWPRAMQHVLGTFDPRVTGMRPWETVNLSTDGHDIIDLTDTQTGDTGMPELTQAELEALQGLAAVAPSLVGMVNAFDTDESGESSDDEPLFDGYNFDTSVDQDADHLAGAGAGGVVLSNEHGDGDAWGWDDEGVDISGGAGESVELSTMREELAAVRGQLAATEWAKQREGLLADGVPPVMLDKAEVLLSNPGASSVVELSNGDTIDPVGVLREVLEAARGLVDLSAPLGHEQDTDTDTRDDELVKLLEADL